MSCQLVITMPDGGQQMVPLTSEKVTLGRSEGNSLSFPDDPMLSRQHLEFECERQTWYVTDLGSKNGTLVNGIPISGRRKLESEDVVSAGHLQIALKVEQEKAAPVPFEFVDEPATPTLGTSTISINLERVLREPLPAPGPAATTGTDKGGEMRRMRALIDAGRELAGHRPLGELFQTILKLAADAVGARRGVLMTLEDGELVARAAQGEGFRISTAVRDKVLSEKSSLLVRDASLDEALRASRTIVQQRVRSLMAVPLQTTQKVIGLIYLDSPDFVRPFVTEDLNLLTVMANIAAIRIEHARLVEVEQAERLLAKELEQAAEIQRGLLPSSAPEIPGLDLAGSSIPCKEVGGDYYDFLPLPDGRIAVVVADVAGKGMPASLLASSIQARLQVLSQQPLEVGALVTQLNNSIQPHCPDNRFITCFLCIIDPRTGELSYCNAGHNPAILLRANGEMEFLKEGGLFLGRLRNLKFNEASTRLQEGDLVVLFSDGVTEARRGDSEEFFGDDRFEAVLRQNAALPACDMVTAVRDSVNGFLENCPPLDDITLVVVRRALKAGSPMSATASG